MKKIISFLRGLTLDLRRFLAKVNEYTHSVIKSVELKIRRFCEWMSWPRWYFAILFAGMLLMGVEVVGTWFGFVWPVMGLFIHLYRKDMKDAQSEDTNSKV